MHVQARLVYITGSQARLVYISGSHRQYRACAQVSELVDKVEAEGGGEAANASAEPPAPRAAALQRPPARGLLKASACPPGTAACAPPVQAYMNYYSRLRCALRLTSHGRPPDGCSWRPGRQSCLTLAASAARLDGPDSLRPCNRACGSCARQLTSSNE